MALTMQGLTKLVKASLEHMMTVSIASLVTIEFCTKYIFGRVQDLMSRFGGYPVVEWLRTECLNYIKIIFGDGEAVIKCSGQILSKPTPCNVRIGSMRFVYLDKPEDIQVVLNSSKCLEKAHHYTFLSALGDGLLTSTVDKWKKHRRLINPVFNTRLLSSFSSIFNQKNKLLIDKLKEECTPDKVIDIHDYVERTNFEILCETMMGYDAERLITENEKAEFRRAMKILQELYSARMVNVLLHPNFIFNTYSKIKGYSRLDYLTKKFVKEIITHKKKTHKDIKTKLHVYGDTEDLTSKQKTSITFLDKLLELNEEGSGFTDQHLYDEVVTMLATGSETSAKTDAFTLLMLAMHPEIQKQAYNEIISVLGEEDRLITMDDVENMPFLEQCIRETIRLFPLAPYIVRTASDDLKLDSNKHFVIKKGDDILISPYMVHRNPNIYHRPLEWNPNNFSPEAMKMRHKHSFLGFSGGPRGCVGSRYAMLSIKIIISTILKNFILTTDVKLGDIRLSFDVTLNSVTGYKVKLHARRPLPESAHYF